MTEVVVSSVQGQGLTHEVRARGHTLRTDEPEPRGADTGPTPYELLLGALGACTAMTIRLYAERKQWPLESVQVTLHHGRVHLEDCQDCDEKDRRLERITKRITMTGGLSEEQRTRLVQIAARCPVHRTLHSGGLRIEQELV